MSNPNKSLTQQANYKLTPELVRQIKAEARMLHIYPAKVVEHRLRHSYAVSVVLPPDNTAA